MKINNYIFFFIIFLVACNPRSQSDEPTFHKTIADCDSVYLIADIQWHKQYYPLLQQQVFSIDLLSDGLSFDSSHHIVGTGCNLYLSDVFLPLTDTHLQAGTYQMDTTAAAYTFLPFMNFDGNITGCYLLDIQDNNIQQIIGFCAGQMQVEYISETDIRLDFVLYTNDSTSYHAIYQGATDKND